MLELYWGMLTIGVLCALVSLLFGDLLGHAFDGALAALSLDGLDWFQPMTVLSGLTVLGGAGVLLTRYTAQSAGVVLLLSVLIAAACSLATYMLYVKPLRNSENSVAFSMAELVGALGEVSVPVPAKGYGEVLLRVGGGVTNQPAASFDGKPIPDGARVVVIDTKEGTLLVSEWEDIH